MKTKNGVKVALIATLIFAASGIGCSGWKISNPFSRKPDASNAQEPKELKELDELNDITPPPESYTSNDSTAKSEKTSSLAQRGKYDPEPEATKTAEVAMKSDDKPLENFKTADYSQSYQTLNPNANDNVNALAGGVGSTQQGTMNLPSESSQPALGQIPQTSPQTYAAQSPVAPVQTQTNQVYNDASAPSAVANNAPFPTVDSSFPEVEAPFPEAPFPSAPASADLYAANPPQATQPQTTPAQNQQPNQNLYASPAYNPPAYNPIAQVSGAAAAPHASAVQQNASHYPQTQTDRQPVAEQQEPALGLAYNFDAQQLPSAPQYDAPADNNTFDSNTNPYSNVIYEPQTVSGGFVPEASPIY